MKNYCNFIGIDISKETFDAYFQEKKEHSSFKNNGKGFAQLLKWVKNLKGSKDMSDVLYCCENTGMYSLALCEYLSERQLNIWEESPYKIHRSSGFVRGKDDIIDSIRIAKYAYTHREEFVQFVPDTKFWKNLNNLYGARETLVQEKTTLSNKLQSLELSCGKNSKACKSIKTLRNQLSKSIEDINQEMEELIMSEPEYKKNYLLLRSIKGVGPVIATMMLIVTKNFARFEYNPRKFSCYVCAAPFKRQSGTALHTQPHVSKIGSRKLKGLMVMGTKIAMIYNPTIKAYDERLKEENKLYGVRVNNCMNKLIRIAFAVVKSGIPFDSEYNRDKYCDEVKCTKENTDLNQDDLKKVAASPICPSELDIVYNMSDNNRKEEIIEKSYIELGNNVFSQKILE